MLERCIDLSRNRMLRAMPEPTKMMIALEFASKGAEEMSDSRLPDGNGTNPFRLALCRGS